MRFFRIGRVDEPTLVVCGVTRLGDVKRQAQSHRLVRVKSFFFVYTTVGVWMRWVSCYGAVLI